MMIQILKTLTAKCRRGAQSVEDLPRTQADLSVEDDPSREAPIFRLPSWPNNLFDAIQSLDRGTIRTLFWLCPN